MKPPTNEVRNLIANHSSIANFGTPADAVGDDSIGKAEVELNRPLPDSYKWFLREYVGGEIGGEEIYSLYGKPLDSVSDGDVVFQHIANHKAALLEDLKLVISETDFGEVFYLDYTKFQSDECPIFLRLPSGQCVHYADSFYEFPTPSYCCSFVVVASSAH